MWSRALRPVSPIKLARRISYAAAYDLKGPAYPNPTKHLKLSMPADRAAGGGAAMESRLSPTTGASRCQTAG
jgi:hypothetical protein